MCNETRRRPRADRGTGATAVAPIGYLIAAGLYLIVLLPWLIVDMGLHPHPRAYLLEFRLASPARLTGDVIVNVAMFVPLGWLLARGLGGRAASALARVLIVTGFCGGLSLAMETLQFFLTTRYSSLIDVLANTLGAVAGAVIACRWRR